MLKFIKNWKKQAKIKAQIEKYRLKTEVMRYKGAYLNNISKKKASSMNNTLRELESAENLKQYVADTLPANTIVQILNNPTVQQLAKAVTLKLMSGGQVSAQDDELVTIYKKLPDDIKVKVKEFAIGYIGGGK